MSLSQMALPEINMQNNPRLNLVRFLIENNAVFHSNLPLKMKSGISCYFDTDLRNAISTCGNLRRLASLVYDCLPCSAVKPQTGFLGVPETGHLLAVALSFEHANRVARDVPINLIRAATKDYQGAKTKDTVLPICKTRPLVLVEDDVVSGGTIRETVRRFPKGQFTHIVSVMDRDPNVAESLNRLSDATYSCCATLTEILHELTAQNDRLNLVTGIKKYLSQSSGAISR